MATAYLEKMLSKKVSCPLPPYNIPYGFINNKLRFKFKILLKRIFKTELQL